MGVGRSYTSRVLQKFKADGVLDTSREALTVVDCDALLSKSCQCNDSFTAHFDVVLQGVCPETD